MGANTVTLFPQVNWQAVCATLSARLLAAETRYTNQDVARIGEIDAAAEKNAELQQRVALLQSQNQELIRQQAEAAVLRQTDLTQAKSNAESLQIQAANAIGAATKATTASRRWRKSLFILVPTAACASMVATFHYHAAIQSALSWLMVSFR